MVTFLSGGTGTPKLLAGASTVFDPGSTTVICNTGDDVELGGLFVCPDVDTVLYEQSGLLDRERWWGIAEDTSTTHAFLRDLTDAADIEVDDGYLPPERQIEGRALARWRRFSAAGEFMHIGDRDRAIHLLRTSLLDGGATLTEVTRTLGRALEVDMEVLPMTDDPVASLIDTEYGLMHFQTFWVGRGGEPRVRGVEYRGGPAARPTAAVLEALSAPVVIGPANPITSIGPMRSMPALEDALRDTAVVAVSPFVEDRVFSGPAANLMDGVGYEPSTAGVAGCYPFVDAFVLDEADRTDLDRLAVRTDTAMATPADARRVASAARTALEEVE